MCSDKRRMIMIVDDDAEERMMLNYILSDEGYRCIEVHDEESVVDMVQFHQPDLILMDRIMPHRSGLEISIEIKSKHSISQIPIIMVTAADKIEEKIEALEDGVDDYICKPYEPRELLAKIKAILRSSKQAIDRNPTTLLPGAPALENEIQKHIENGNIFFLCHADLDNFKPYADSHGFSLANDVIKKTGKLVSDILEKSQDPYTFVAHIGGDDFILIISPEKWKMVTDEIIETFDREIKDFFYEDELIQGYYISKNREGVETRFLIMTISIGIISNERKKYKNPTEMGLDLSVAKKKAKTIEKSNSLFWDPANTPE